MIFMRARARALDIFEILYTFFPGKQEETSNLERRHEKILPNDHC